MMRKLTALFSLILACLLLSGCAFFHMYRQNIQQGNVMCAASIEQLKPGMTTDQVLYILGTPVLSNTFQPNRWDYVYTYKPGGKPRSQYHVTLIFAGNILQDIRVSPTEIIR